jgi:hypothetical protein
MNPEFTEMGAALAVNRRSKMGILDAGVRRTVIVLRGALTRACMRRKMIRRSEGDDHAQCNRCRRRFATCIERRIPRVYGDRGRSRSGEARAFSNTREADGHEGADGGRDE